MTVSGGRIEDIGRMDGIGEIDADLVIDAGCGVVLPGLVNSHCHAAMTLFRGMADDLELMAWLNDHIFPAEAKHVNPEMVYWCAKLGAAEMLLSGTTTVADGYFFEDEAARAFTGAGMRAVAAQGVVDFPVPGVADPADNIGSAVRFMDTWLGRDELITPAVFAHAPYTCSNRTLQKAKEETRRRGLPFFIHVAETEAELSLIREARGRSPVKHLDALGVLDEQTVCVHCVWVDDEDMDILARCRSGIVLCPQSNMKLASGMAPLAGMLDRQLIVGLGTDSAASNNSLDLFREMDLCAKMQKVRNLDPVAGKAGEVLRMATGNGAAVLGFGPQGGTLRIGAPADLIVVDRNSPHLQPFYGPDLLVYAAVGSDVRHVIVNGRLVVQDRGLLTMDLGETMDRVRGFAGIPASRHRLSAWKPRFT
jgi:5-methylthioadenosine/S-adenosylhomocysteine deaminase